MTKLTIYGVPQSNFVRAARMAAEEKGVDYVLENAMPHTDVINAIHPLGKMPAMRHGDVVLAESKAIASYIDQAFDGPRLFPTDPEANAKVEQWVSLINTAFNPIMVQGYLMAYFFSKNEDGSPDQDLIKKNLPELEKYLSILNEGVSQTGYLVGKELTYADIAIYPTLHYLATMPESSAIISTLDNLGVYIKKLAARESAKNTLSEAPKKDAA